MSIWPCDVPDCPRKALVKIGDCMCCGKHICGYHFEDPGQHPCVSMDEDERDRLEWSYLPRQHRKMVKKIDINKLVVEATTLRPGHTCTGPTKPLTSRGAPLLSHGCNVMVPITFDDGVKWLVRIKKPLLVQPPKEALRLNSTSEYATMKALKEIGAKVPGVWRSDSPHDPSLIYFWLEFVPGEISEPFLGSRLSALTSAHLLSISNLAKFYIQLEKASYDQVGSLTLDAAGGICVGPVMDRTAMLPQAPFFLGPFPTAKARYLAFFDTTLRMILAGERVLPKDELVGYLVHLEARTLVAGCEELDQGPWYIKHGEDKGDHLLVADDGHITSVIDWEWSFLTSKGDAFAAPDAFTNMEFWDGSNQLSMREEALAQSYERDHARPDLATCVRRGKRYQRLYCLMTSTRRYHVEQLNALRRAFLDIPDGIEGEPATIDQWVQAAKLRYEGDEGLVALLARKAWRHKGL